MESALPRVPAAAGNVRRSKTREFVNIKTPGSPGIEEPGLAVPTRGKTRRKNTRIGGIMVELSPPRDVRV